MGKLFRGLREITPIVSVEKEIPEWQPDADMVWAKGVCENDVQEGFTYKVLQMISNGYVYTDIVVPSGGAVKTSDGGYYTANAKHTWNDSNARAAQAPQNVGLKLRWLIYYYTTEEPTIALLKEVMYACFDGVKFDKIFGNKYSLQYFDIINGADLRSSATIITNMFFNCYSLQSMPLLDTSNVTTMGNMFRSCYSLQYVPLFNTSNVTSMSDMFSGCYSLQTIPLFDTSNMTNMSSMFQNCYSLQSVPQFNTSNVTNMGDMFSNCYFLRTVPLFDTSNVTTMGNMFSNCTSLQSVPLFDTSNVTSMSGMLSGCYSLQTVPLFDTSNVTSMSVMFSGCYSLQTVPLFSTSNVTTIGSMFANCSSLQSISLNLNSTTNVNAMFVSCSYLEFLTLTNIGVSLSISSSTKYSVETLVDIIANLKDLTGLTAQTLTMGTTNKNKLSADQIAVATAKNWSIA